MKKNELLTELLNLQCNRTERPIEVGEVVRIHNWGGKGEPIGYGHFEWDEQDRSFCFKDNELLNSIYGHKNNACSIDSYDLFRTSPETLTDKEVKALNG